MRVLLIEDNQTDALLIRKKLEVASGGQWSVEHVDRLEAGLNRLHDEDFDALLLDLCLPDSQGLDTLNRALESSPRLPIVVLTGQDDESAGRNAVHQGAQDYLVKEQTDAPLLHRSIQYAVERQSLQDRLVAKETRFRHIIQNHVDAVIVVDRRGVVRFANPMVEEMVGRNADEISGAVFGFPVTAGLTAEIAVIRHTSAGVETTAAGMRVVEIEWEGETAYLAALRDISERKRSEEKLAEQARELERFNVELERSNRELRDFAHVVSHDLRSPLRTISSFCQLIRRELPDCSSTDVERYLQHVLEGTGRMSAMIEAVLEYSRVGTLGMDLQPTDVAKVLRTAVSNLQAEIAETGAAVTHGPLPVVTADAGQLVQLLQNLIGNAVKFRRRDERPSIRLAAERRGNEWLFTLSDNGIGIAPEQSERIFRIFRRLHATDEYPGTGIGLTICQKIVQRHDGQIWVDSQPGQGSTFSFTLPVDACQDS